MSVTALCVLTWQEAVHATGLYHRTVCLQPGRFRSCSSSLRVRTPGGHQLQQELVHTQRENVGARELRTLAFSDTITGTWSLSMQISVLRLTQHEMYRVGLTMARTRDLGLLTEGPCRCKSTMPRASKRQRNEPARLHPADAPSSSGREHRAISDHTAEIQDELLLKVGCQALLSHCAG